ncbi:16S rRNA (cytosine(967)-C(5))-methyltransferase RsmB [Rubricoccus marinus]|uniref:16S rRNA (cytosine(967)-C(5))-methyltransferase n=1 Tax=Rubricoccus marinus TaxID=716817 RepID=A0A259TXS1_9BACT|nr:16S rRNA (cytosine(967)-C(5))-methyltransferase RsmB [Rubricoccus marinus]OZC02496.1 16S rRNA (cytosine(967)-C(5))-methyltransferase [Rubricoccus marinus]
MPRPDPARLLAAERLLRVEEEGAFVARLGIDREGAAPEAERRALALVAGVSRWRRWLDWSLQQFLRQPFASLDVELQQALRIGAFELLIEEKPAHAAVSEAVDVAQALLHKGAAGLANAVLRKLARARDAGALAEPASGDEALDLATRLSHPTWLTRRWLDRYGADATRALLDADNAIPRYSLRANRLSTTPEALHDALLAAGADPERSRWSDDLLTVERLGPAIQGGLLARGEAAVQDEAASLVVRVLDPQPGESILDGTAAPGGKAIYAAERMGNQGRVVAVDLHANKTRLIGTAAEAHGATIVEPLATNLITWDSAETYDRVLLDAPCSGTGVLGKRADMRWRRMPEDLRDLTDLQDRLLNAAAARVRPGGLLVYSTCSLEPEENESRVAAFLDRHPEFSHEPIGGEVPDAMRTPEGNYAALPHVHGTDGAFAARLRRSQP